MNIRHYEPADAPRLSVLYRRSVELIGSRYYSPRQVEAWASLTPSPARLQQFASDGRVTLVAVDGSDLPMAFADLEGDGHIHFLYCAPEAVGKGVASALYDALEDVARRRGMVRLYAEASEAARAFFERKGFVVTATRRFEVQGVGIHNYAVEKILDGTELS